MQKKIPMRQCLGCREMKPKKENGITFGDTTLYQKFCKPLTVATIFLVPFSRILRITGGRLWIVAQKCFSPIRMTTLDLPFHARIRHGIQTSTSSWTSIFLNIKHSNRQRSLAIQLPVRHMKTRQSVITVSLKPPARLP